jgi:Fe-S cluster assembly scaffold protein SufB
MRKRKFVHKLIKNIEKMRDSILTDAMKSGKLTEKEYIKRYKGRYHDDHGIDSFIQYLDTSLKGGDKVFVTLNDKILRDKAKLETKFGTRILHPQEAIEELEQEDAEKFAERMNIIAA